jgi:2-polyprenyl-3-methyl-5-hydroxy-6-metoxy-1,4-benzoquinol methylase
MRASQKDSGNRSCPACSSSHAIPQGQKNGFEMLSCLNCDTLYTQTLPTANASQDYDSYYDAENLSVPAFIDQRLDEIVRGFRRYRRSNRLLDIGCGAGSLLQAATRAGWDAVGVEVSRPAVDHIRLVGLNAFCGQLSEADFPNAHFDVVTASELLEHVSDPGSLVSEIVRILMPGGLCWITTPNSRGASARVLKLDWSVVSPPEHLHLFSAPGLETLLLNHGFRRVKIQTEGVNPIELWRGWRKQATVECASSQSEGTNRVHSSYELNEALLSSKPRRAVKNLVNAALRASRLGDSLKVWAER